MEAEGVVQAVLSDPAVREARERVEAAETETGTELCARLQSFQDRYDQTVAEGDSDGLAGLCPGKDGRRRTTTDKNPQIITPELNPGRRPCLLARPFVLGPARR
ncbi:hypothetical protein [Streptomyces sp. HSG2]|uniref:hypothetical protein n=1 Tax=Streptomyces sp. HSG2 TaxID=2797167 RepID=UPI001F5B4BE6|nr:hypothetical protein [Streptomyces sp. HSG2]